MAYFDLTELIDDKVNQNGVNAITGTVLNAVLIRMVEDLGAGMKFMGVVTPTSIPPTEDFPKFCIAFKSGHYINFGIQSQAAFLNGFAVLFDINGDNTWQISIWQMPANAAAVPFVVDAVVKNNELRGDTILYVSEASRTQSRSSFTVKQTNTSGDDLGVVAVYSGAAENDEIKSYDLSIANTDSTLSISVNWSAVPSGETVNFEYSEPIPTSAYSKQLPSVNIVEPVPLIAIAVDYVGSEYYYAIKTQKNFDAGIDEYLTRTDISNLLKKTSIHIKLSSNYLQPKTSSVFHLCEVSNGKFSYKTLEYHHNSSGVQGIPDGTELWKEFTRYEVSI